MTVSTDVLLHPPSNYVAGRFVPVEGCEITSADPAEPDRIIWRGAAPTSHADEAVAAARSAFETWSARPIEERIETLRRWKHITAKHADRLAGLITDEMGKTIAESRFEADALGAKVDITLSEHSFGRVTEYEVDVSRTRAGLCRFKPHGVMLVLGPYNFPAHLPNGHFVPALLMGNTVVLKPSEKTPAVGQLLAELMHETGLPPGVFNVVQGGADVAAHLVHHDDIDGVLFTGSWPVGRTILEASVDRPGRIVALEMGGSNAAVVLPDADLRQAVVECVRAGFATTGQRCTCTRRIVVHERIAERFISAFCKAASTLLIGHGRSSEPVFMGPIVSAHAADAVIEFQRKLADAGGSVLMPCTRVDRPGHFITPGVVRVGRFGLEHDCEVFGPLVQIAVARDLDDAIAQANATQYGLAASIFTSDDAAYETFFRRVRCGCINRNTGTAGASSKLPFGGVGRSGNHRPAGAFSVDYCAYPVANMVETGSDAPVPSGMHWDDAWLS